MIKRSGHVKLDGPYARTLATQQVAMPVDIDKDWTVETVTHATYANLSNQEYSATEILLLGSDCDSEQEEKEQTRDELIDAIHSTDTDSDGNYTHVIHMRNL